MVELDDERATAILSGRVGAVLDRGLTWSRLNMRRDGVPTKIEGAARLSCATVLDPFNVVMRLRPDKPWEYTCILLHVPSGTNVRRLDVRGTHRDRVLDQEWINQTHKHQWSEQDANRSVYTPDDIRHDPGIPDCTSMKDLAVEYERVFEDFVIECRIEFAPTYFWINPPYPEVQDALPTFERYP